MWLVWAFAVLVWFFVFVVLIATYNGNKILRSWSGCETNYQIINVGFTPIIHTNTCFGASFYSADTHHGNTHQLPVVTSRVTYLFSGPTWEPALTNPNAREKWRGLDWMKLNWPGKVDIRTKLPDEVSMAIFWPPPGFRARTLDLWVLKRGNLNFCVHTTSLPDPSAVKKDFRASAYILKRTRWRRDGSFLVQFNVLENLGLKIEKPTFSEYPSHQQTGRSGFRELVGLMAPIHVRTRSDDRISCYGKPEE